jgi:transcriptional regulator with XRE-family HTH domain
MTDNDSLKEAFASRFKLLRTAAGLTQEAIAKHVGKSKQIASFWERGKFLPMAPELVGLARLFHTSTDYLLGLQATPTASRGGTLVPYPTYMEIMVTAQENLNFDQVGRRWLSNLKEPGLIAIHVFDASMAPRIPAGATITVKLQRQPQANEVGVVVLLTSRELLIRRFGDKEGLLVPDSGDYGIGRIIGKADRPVIIGTLVETYIPGTR